MFGRTLAFAFFVTFGATLLVSHFRAPEGAAALTQAAGTAPPPSPAVAAAPLPYGGTAELRRDGDGHFRADVLVNGQPMRMVVDTGASMIVLGEADAQRLGISPLPSAYTARAQTANGVIEYAPIRLASVRVGNVERIDIRAAVVRGDQMGMPLLGQSFLGALTEMSVAGDRMRMR